MSRIVEFEPPLDIAGSLELFRRPGDDLIDRWDGSTLLRVLQVDGECIPFAAALDGTPDAPAFRFTTSRPEHELAVQRAIAQTFVASARDYAALLQRDPVLRRLDAQFPGIRQIRQLDLFTALIRCISAQQVNLRWAATTRRRLAERFGVRHEVDGHVVYSLDAQRIAGVKPEEIRALQFTTSKSVAIVAVAQALVDSDVTLEALHALDDEEVIARLVTIRGIGRWSAEWVLARTLGRPRVVAGDLGVRKAVGLAYAGGQMPSEAETRHLTAHWGASAGTAQALLLHALAEKAFSPARP
jgi:DNA-3-methyladenine glycosylase II